MKTTRSALILAITGLVAVGVGSQVFSPTTAHPVGAAYSAPPFIPGQPQSPAGAPQASPPAVPLDKSVPRSQGSTGTGQPTPALASPAELDPQALAVAEYLARALTYRWATDITAYAEKLTPLSARDAALDFPLAGASYAACLANKCSTANVTVQEVTRTSGNSFDLAASWDLRIGSERTRQAANCTVTVDASNIVNRSCAAIASKEKSN